MARGCGAGGRNRSVRFRFFWPPRRVRSGGQKEYRTRIAGRQKGGQEFFPGAFGIIASDSATCTKFGLLARIIRSAAVTPGTPPIPDTPNDTSVGADSIHHAPRDASLHEEREECFTGLRFIPPHWGFNRGHSIASSRRISTLADGTRSVPATLCPGQESNLQPREFKPHRSSVGVPGRVSSFCIPHSTFHIFRVVLGGLEPPIVSL